MLSLNQLTLSAPQVICLLLFGGSAQLGIAKRGGKSATDSNTGGPKSERSSSLRRITRKKTHQTHQTSLTGLLDMTSDEAATLIRPPPPPAAEAGIGAPLPVRDIFFFSFLCCGC